MTDLIGGGIAGRDETFFRLGDVTLDYHHARLLGCLKRLAAATRQSFAVEPVDLIASDLFESWIAHCNAEKVAMDRSDWPDSDRHKDDHGRLTLELTTLLYRHMRAETGVRLEQMVEIFIGYLIEHLDQFDRPLGAHLVDLGRRQDRPASDAD